MLTYAVLHMCHLVISKPETIVGSERIIKPPVDGGFIVLFIQFVQWTFLKHGVFVRTVSVRVAFRVFASKFSVDVTKTGPVLCSLCEFSS